MHQQQLPTPAHASAAAHYSAPNTASYPYQPQPPAMPRSASWQAQQQQQSGGYYRHPLQRQQPAFRDQREPHFTEYHHHSPMQMSSPAHPHGTHGAQSLQSQQQQSSQRHSTSTSSISKILG
ncbi:hypothetical protein GGH95_002124 [Coemansia sp. RSA 1836]|nr:hypothetical protein GGH95_002124 [Coemansia sp. RSA 1836]